ncbi:MAG: GAF domain-containing protein [Candidatus Marinimicrobia bacterium]|nr:GAF domain-containing protein [Candidatus Neomarinimicrobiota bacterium]MDD5583031.1 GAF domain-containing protein [Candidatus Neomarinimicrobiota bacterium]
MELSVSQLKGLMNIFTELEPEEILRKSVEQVSEILEAKGCTIFLYNESTDSIELAETTSPYVQDASIVRYSRGEGLTGWVFKFQKPLLIQDFDEKSEKDLKKEHGEEIYWINKFSDGDQQIAKSYLAVPIISKSGRFYGVIRASSNEYNFDESHQELLIHIAGYISIALENSYHYLQERKKADYFKLLMEFGTRLHTHYNQTDLLNFVAEAATRTFSAETSEIYLLKEKISDVLVLRAGYGVPKELINKAEHKIGEGLTGTLVKENRIIRLNNVLTFPQYKGKYRSQMKQNLKHGDRLAFLGCPIALKSDVIGCIKLYNKIPKYPGDQAIFSEDDEKYIAILADMLSVALENLQYLESMKTSAIQMFKTQRLTALGTMAIRLPNEVINPLTTAQLNVLNLKRKIEKNNGIKSEDILKRLAIIEEKLTEVADGIKALQVFSTKAGFLKVRKTWTDIIDESLLFLSDEIIRKKITVYRDREAERSIPNVVVETNEMMEVVINLLLIAISQIQHYYGSIHINVSYDDGSDVIKTTIVSQDNESMQPLGSAISMLPDGSEIVTPQQFMFTVAKEIVHTNYQGMINLKPEKNGISITLEIPAGRKNV